MDADQSYNEFGFLREYAEREGLKWKGQPTVARRFYKVNSEQQVSSLQWTNAEPELWFLHGGGQNAHTWDSVALALDVPMIAFDLPGHGHSDWRDDHDYGAWPNADAIASAIVQVTDKAKPLIGMSLGGSTAIRLTAKYPELITRLVIVDITPSSRSRIGSLTNEQRGATLLLDGPKVFDSFEEMVTAAAATVPGRPIDTLRAGVRHNSRELPDGRWAWRYDPVRLPGGGTPENRELLWDDLSRITCPIVLVRGGKSAMVQDGDIDRLLERQPNARVEVVDGAGHSIQSDRPLQLAEIIRSFALDQRD